MSWEGCLVGFGGGLKMFGDMQDKEYVNIGGGWCISDGMCFWREKVGLKRVEKVHSNIKN